MSPSFIPTRSSVPIAGLCALVWSASTATRACALDNAVIKGKVIFKGDPEKEEYKRVKLDTTKDENCKKSVEKIYKESVILNKKTDPITVRNVLVHVKDGLGEGNFEPPQEAVKLTQVGCRYEPHVVSLMAGQPLKVLNGDDTNHNINFQPAKNTPENFSQPKKDLEKGRELKFIAEAPFHVKCDVHGWMGMHVAVFNHPFFSVTGEEGTFEIKGLPPGKYTVEAWHEKFGTMTATVEVTSGATKEADFTFEPDKK